MWKSILLLSAHIIYTSGRFFFSFSFFAFYITMTGPKGVSTITGQNKVTYMLVIDPDKYGNIFSEWHFCSGLVYNRSISCCIATPEKAFQFICSKNLEYHRLKMTNYLLCQQRRFHSTPFTKASFKKEERMKVEKHRCSPLFHSTRELWSFTCKWPLAEI